MKRIFFIFFGLIVIVSALFFWTIINEGSKKKQAVYAADHARLLAECRALIATNQITPRDESKYDKPLVRVYNKTDSLFYKREMREVASLKPSYIAVSDKEVMICLSALPRIYVLVFRTNVQEYGAKCITNGVWISNNPARDRLTVLQLNNSTDGK